MRRPGRSSCQGVCIKTYDERIKLWIFYSNHLRSDPFIAEAEQAGTLQLYAWVYNLVSERMRTYETAAGYFMEEPPFTE